MQIQRVEVSLSIFLLCFIHFLAGEEGKVIRAAIDIGMGGPKLHIAEVDVQTNKIIKTLHTQRYFVDFYNSVSKHAHSNLSSDIMEEGFKAFNEAVKMAKTFNPKGIVAIATASFRSTPNGMHFAHHLQKEIGIKIHIIDQCLEGKLTFQAVLSKTDVDPETLVVWDVGGGSIQFTAKAQGDSYLVNCQEEGAGAFKDYIIETIQGRNTQEFSSPNPMSSQDIVQATAFARTWIEKVEPVFKDKISHPTASIVGAGSVFGFGISGMLSNKTTFHVEDLALVVQSLEGKTDADLGGGDYAYCEGSNAILVLGYMQALNIQQMQIINVNNADGVMTYRPFWE